ncbi:MAG: hypothetical protein IMX00_09825 [Limnochordales bacterium]|nr:hypothetical protein [Limnochordales bacterium]
MIFLVDKSGNFRKQPIPTPLSYPNPYQTNRGSNPSANVSRPPTGKAWIKSQDGMQIADLTSLAIRPTQTGRWELVVNGFVFGRYLEKEDAEVAMRSIERWLAQGHTGVYQVIAGGEA